MSSVKYSIGDKLRLEWPETKIALASVFASSVAMAWSYCLENISTLSMPRLTSFGGPMSSEFCCTILGFSRSICPNHSKAGRTRGLTKWSNFNNRLLTKTRTTKWLGGTLCRKFLRAKWVYFTRSVKVITLFTSGNSSWSVEFLWRS